MKSFLLCCFLTLSSAFQLPIRVLQGIDVNDRWYAILTNTSPNKVTTRVSGRIVIHDWYGKVLESHAVPLGGLHLDPTKSVMTELTSPLVAPHCRGKEPFLLTCKLSFVDLDKQFKETIFWGHRP